MQSRTVRQAVARAGRGSIARSLPVPGKPLDASLRHDMEERFGHNFAKVRVHTDPLAARSAEAVNAKAYTVGPDVFFGAGRYAPDTRDGQQLIAHELAHVVQQQGVPGHGTVQTKATNGVARLGSTHTPAEREADRAALAVTAGRPVRIDQRVDAGTVQRSVLGSIAGTLIGGGITALAAYSIFGPLGAVVGGLLGGFAGLIAGASESADSRKLTSQERTEAQRVYGASLDYDRVRVAVSRVMTAPSHARTPYETLYLPPDTIPALEDMEDDFIREGYFKLLIHELIHVWQTQHGIGVVRKAFAASFGSYGYGGRKGLREAWSSGKHFLDFGLEQQGEICADYYERLVQGKDTSAYLPYITELRQDGRRVAPGLVPASEPGDFPVRKRPFA